MRLSDLVGQCGVAITTENATGSPTDPTITDITFDSRHAGPGTLFVALAGARMDGHDFVGAAVQNGASAVLVSSSRAGDFVDLEVPVLAVDEPRRRLGTLAACFFGDPSSDVDVIGITGTNGKTTVTYLVEAVLRHVGVAAGVIGTVSYRWPGHEQAAPNTTPESLVVQRLLARMRADGVRSVAMEVSSHGLATHRLEGTRFAAAVFTNLSQDHLDFHRTMRDYRDAKRSLFLDHLARSGGVGVVNVDDDEGREIAKLIDGPVTTSAAGHEATWSCTSWSQALDGTTMSVETPGGTLQLQTRLLGEFNVSNVLQTLAAAHVVGVDPEAAAAALRDLRGVPGRLEHLGGNGVPHVFVDYAHTPDALQRAIAALRPLTSQRLVVVFGCGGDRDREKRPQMGRIAARDADYAVLTSDNPRSESPRAILSEIEAAMNGDAWVSIEDRAEAIEHAIGTAQENDVILIAGKGHETYQEVDGERRVFDDREHARAALENRR